MSNQIVISSGAKVRSLNGVITGTTGVLDSLPINAANGIPQLDVNGKILVSQLPNSVMEYQGTWNANTNTPTLTNGGAFNQGDVYLCNVAGTTDFGAGPIAFVVGDQVIYSGSIWQRASGSTGTVTSVAVTETGDALTITGSPITTSGTINVGFAGTSAQYVAGNGALVTFPDLTGYVTLSTSQTITGVKTFTNSNIFSGNNLFTTYPNRFNEGIGIKETASYGTISGYTVIAGATNGLSLYLASGGIKTFAFTSGTSNNTFTFPNATGTVALTSDLTGGTVTSVAALTIGTSGTDLSSTVANSTTTPVIALNVPTASATNRGALSSADWTTFNNKQSTLSLTTTGNSGSATLVSNTLNVPTYTLAGLGGISLTSLSATTPLSYNNTTGAFSIQVANTSQDGYLSSTDWNTFNGKQNTITNPVTGTGTSGQVTYFNGTSSVTSSSSFKFDGTNLTIGNPTTALAQLHIYNASAAATILLQTNSTTDYSEIAVRNNSSTATSYFRQYSTAATGSDFGISRAGLALFFSNYATNFAIGTRNGGDLILGTNDVERARMFSATGNLSLNSSSDSGYKLDVNGTGRFTGALSGTSATFSSTNTATAFIPSGATIPTNGMYLSAANTLNFATNTTNRLTISSTGLTTFSAFGTHSFSSGGTGYNKLGIRNTTAGAANGAQLSVGTDADSDQFYIQSFATTFTTSGMNIAGGAVVNGEGPGGLSIAAIQSNIGFYTNGAAAGNLRMNITSTGFVHIGGTASSRRLQVNTSGNDGIRILTSGDNPTLDLMQSAAANVNARNWRIVTNWEGWGTLDFQSGTTNTQDPATTRLSINGTNGVITFNNYGTGTITSTSGVLSAVSDMNLKIEDGFVENALEKVMNLKPRYFLWKEESGLPTDLRQLGFYAQEVNQALGEEVANTPKDEKQNWGIYDRGIIAMLTKAMQEQQVQIEELKLKIK